MNIRMCKRNPSRIISRVLGAFVVLTLATMFVGTTSTYAQPCGDTTGVTKPDVAKFKIRNIGFNANTEDIEYAPTVTADGKTLYFVSDRPGGIGGHDFWVVTKTERLDTVVSKPINVGKPVNTELNEGVASIAADGQTIYFTGCERADGLGDCDIYEAELDGTQWKNMRNVMEINSPYWDSQPSISSDGKTMYFVSNRPGAIGGEGDADIYISKKGADGKWSTPRNAGPTINTSEKEDSPFILAGGKILYFSSAGHGGLGGLDFFSTYVLPDGKFCPPENLPEPINTKEDERFITLPAAGDIIYFSSQRRDLPNAGQLDIFEGRLPPKIINIMISGRLFDRCTNANLPGAITFVNTTTGDTAYNATINASNGTYSFIMTGGPATTIKATGSSPGYPAISETFDIPATKKYLEIKHDFPVGATPVLDTSIAMSDWVIHLPATAPAKYKNFHGLVVEENTVTELYPLLTYVFFDSGSAAIPSRYILYDNPDQTNAFDDSKVPGGTMEKYHHMLNIVGYRMKTHPDTKIKIVGCNSREPGINEVKSVSEARGQVVYDYLTRIWQIDASRITLLPARDLPERASNIRDPLGITENRRTEIQVDDPSGKGWDIVKPIVQIDQRLTPDPESMMFKMKNGIADALVARRAIEIKRNGVMWHVMTNIGKTDAMSPAYNWGKSGNAEDFPKDDGDYTAQLVLYSADGKECRSNEVIIPVLQASQRIKVQEIHADKTIDKFSLVLFKFDSDEAGPLNERILREYIYKSIGKGAIIDVTGYTDVVGLDDRNMRLSQQRAATVTNGIKKNVSVSVYASLNGKGVGETAPLYDNSLQEGRFYNRTVQVVIETPKLETPQ